jgi:hypothetical protein
MVTLVGLADCSAIEVLIKKIRCQVQTVSQLVEVWLEMEQVYHQVQVSRPLSLVVCYLL